MSCGVTQASDVRSLAVREEVPWTDPSEIQRGLIRHDAQTLFWVIYFPKGSKSIHSYWETEDALKDFVKRNPGREKGA